MHEGCVQAKSAVDASVAVVTGPELDSEELAWRGVAGSGGAGGGGSGGPGRPRLARASEGEVEAPVQGGAGGDLPASPLKSAAT